MLSSTVRRSLLSLLAVSTVGTLGFSAAATLDLTGGDSLGAGSRVVASCLGVGQSLEITYQTGYSATPAPPGFKVTGVTLTQTGGTDLDGCLNQVATLVLVDGDDAVVAGGPVAPSAAITASQTEITFTGLTASAAAVEGVHVLITSP
ncbi:MAG: hypothetical protein KG028_10550 [Actinobacteria bacterium]|nr:hypothetical protein [Actinomycetota bacterium]